MYKMLITGLAASIGVAGWPNLADAGLFSKTGPVIAIIANDLFLGEAEGHLSGAGTIAVQSQRNPDVTCLGQFTSSAELGGSGQMRCSNGAAGAYHFKRLSLAKGYGAGSYGQGSMSFTYGLTADESEPYLELPPGKKLKHNGKKLELVDISPAQAAALEVMLNAVTLEVIAIIKQDKDFDYDMEKTPAGWKVYDVKIGGVSLVTTYRETFADQVHDGGVDGLIKSLSDKNRRGDSNLQSFKR